MRRRAPDHGSTRAMDFLNDAVTLTDRRLVMLDAAPAGGPDDFSLHTDAEAICPRCLRWIGPDDYLRRNALGLLQHESCPVFLVPPAPVPQH